MKKKYQAMKKSEILDTCKGFGLPHSGSKELLIERIINYHEFLFEWTEPGDNFVFNSQSKNFNINEVKNIS